MLVVLSITTSTAITTSISTTTINVHGMRESCVYLQLRITKRRACKQCLKKGVIQLGGQTAHSLFVHVFLCLFCVFILIVIIAIIGIIITIIIIIILFLSFWSAPPTKTSAEPRAEELAELSSGICARSKPRTSSSFGALETPWDDARTLNSANEKERSWASV